MMKRLAILAAVAALFFISCRSNGGSFTQEELLLNREGKQIYGVLYRPEGVEKAPLIVISHGFGGTHLFGKAYSETLAPLGYAVYCYDFCGGSPMSQSDGLTTEMSIFSEEKDLLAVVEGLGADEHIDAGKPILIGESQGGMVSALAAGDNPDRFGKVILIYPALCIKDDWVKMYPALSDMPEEVDFWGIKLSHAYLEGLYDLDVYGRISQYKGPVLIFHGDEDKVVPVSYAVEAQKAYDQASLTIYPGAGHGFSPDIQKQTIEAIKEFLKK